MRKSQDVADIPASAADTAPRSVPAALNLATAGYLLHVLFSTAVLALFILNLGEVAGAVGRMNPGMSQSQIDATVNSIQLLVNGAHIFFGVLSLCLAFLVRTGRTWVRSASSVVFVLALLEMLYAWSSPTNVPAVLPAQAHPYIIAVQAIMVLLLLICALLQWLPRSSRAFFAARTWRAS